MNNEKIFKLMIFYSVLTDERISEKITNSSLFLEYFVFRINF